MKVSNSNTVWLGYMQLYAKYSIGGVNMGGITSIRVNEICSDHRILKNHL